MDIEDIPEFRRQLLDELRSEQLGGQRRYKRMKRSKKAKRSKRSKRYNRTKRRS